MFTKKILFPCLIASLLAACSFPDVNALMGNATATARKKESPTVTPTITLTPTLSTSTFTQTPTVMGGQIKIVPTETPILTPKPLMTATRGGTPTRGTGRSSGFLTIYVSTQEIFWGACSGTSVTFSVTVGDPRRAYVVELYMRLRNKDYEGFSEWQRFTMEKTGIGAFSHTVTTAQLNEIEGWKYYRHAWVEYQFVVATIAAYVLGRSDIFYKNLSLMPCP